MQHKNQSAAGYILKGYPRISESFILNEIHLLEQMGMDIHIFAVKKEKERKQHAVVNKIQANVSYTPEDTSVMDEAFYIWLTTNLPRFFKSHLRLFWKRPKTYWQTLLYALFGLSLRFPFGRWPLFKRAFLKDFLRAGHIALEVLNAGHIHHLHGHFCHGSTTMTMLVSYMTGIPFSFTAHAKDIYLPKLNPNGLLQTKIKQAEFVVTCTDANRHYLEQLWPNGTPIHTIYHGLDTKLFSPSEREQAAVDRGQKPIILSVGRFVKKKGFPDLVRACQLLRKRGIDFQCRIIGEPDEESEQVQQLIDDLGLMDTVIVEREMNQTELRHAYAKCTIFALACRIVKNGDRDGIPNVLAEAMAMGKPVVSTDISGIPELVEHRVTGMLVPQREPEMLADALEELLANPRLSRQLGKAAQEKIYAIFDSSKTTLTLNELFSQSLATHRAVNHSQGIEMPAQKRLRVQNS